MRINRQDTNGVKPLLAVGEFGYDNYPTGGDAGRVYVGTGAENIPLAKKSEVDAKVVANANITAGTATKVTYDTKGLVTAGTALSAGDIPVLDAGKITTGTLPVDRGGTGVTTVTGTGSVVLNTSPALVTPNIGIAIGTSFNSITGLASVAPLVADTAAVGTSTLTARQDHVHPVQTTISGNAGTATKLATARTINGVSFDGSANITVVDSTKAPLASPTFTGTPTAPTAAVGTSNTVIATTEFVNAEIANDAVPRVVSTDNAIVRFDGTTGAVQDSSVTITDDGNVIIGNTLDNNTRRIGFTTGGGGSSAIESATLGATNQDLIFKTTFGIESEKMRITGQGNVLVTGGGVMGYGVGSGGMVTQLTSKSTAVTLNKPSGNITMDGAALAAGAYVEFLLNNISIQGTDTVELNIIGGLSAGGGSYSIYRVPVPNGCYIGIRNETDVSLSDSIAIKFNVFKGATS